MDCRAGPGTRYWRHLSRLQVSLWPGLAWSVNRKLWELWHKRPGTWMDQIMFGRQEVESGYEKNSVRLHWYHKWYSPEVGIGAASVSDIVNDIPEWIKIHFRMLADDIKVWTVIKALDDGNVLPEYLIKPTAWSDKWRLKPTPSSTR